MKTNSNFTRLTRASSRRPELGVSNAGSEKSRSAAWTHFTSLPHSLSSSGTSDSQPNNHGGASTSNKPIHFGALRSGALRDGQSLHSWRSVLHSAAQGAGASLSGGSLLESIAGMGGLISGIAGLFGGSKETIPSFERFELPSPKDQTLYLRGSTAATGGSESSLPTNSSVLPGSLGNGSQISSQQIVQVVRKALLTSSSLNDIIAEI